MIQFICSFTSFASLGIAGTGFPGALAGTGIAGTGIAGTGIAGTGIARTGIAGTGIAGTGAVSRLAASSIVDRLSAFLHASWKNPLIAESYKKLHGSIYTSLQRILGALYNH